MIEILGISLKGYEVLQFVSTFFLSEENPENVIRIGLKVVFERKGNELEKEQEEGEAKIFLKLDPKSKVYDEEDISYKLAKERYREGIGVEYEQVNPVRIIEIKTSTPSSDDQNSGARESSGHQVIELRFKIDDKINENSKEDDNEKKKYKFGILIRFEIENEGIESESLLKRAMGLSKYAWNFHTCFWGEYENAYPHNGRDINACKIETFLIIPDMLYKSYGQINVLPGSYSIHTVKGRDVDALTLESENNGKKNEDRKRTEKKKMEKWYKPGGLMIKWQWFFEKTHRVSREVVVEHIESSPRFSMFFLIFSLLFVMSFSLFSQDIYNQFFDAKKTSYITFKILSIFVVSIAILFIYVLINLTNYAFHEIRAPDEIASYIYYSCLLVLISFIPSSIFLWENIENKFFTIFESIEYPAATIIILICSYVLIYRLTPWRIKKKFKRKYSSALLPIGALAVFALVIALASNYGVRGFLISWAYLCATSIALLELREIFSMQSH